ncbi:protein ABHD18-like isoform X2 [Tubulanus polymorphus]|uniref:protein ABHD18-like isoform X2 n=1 Tax=Tubulanus polymorphus TaxID=672921 RepID=UPI003DA4E061
MSRSRLDQIYRRLLLTKFFTKGWGKPENIKRIVELKKAFSHRDKCRHLVPSDYPIHIDKEDVQGGCRILEGHFESPFNRVLPGIMPKEVQTAWFQMVLPEKWHGDLKPVVLQHAGTGDHFYWRRRSMIARPLLKEYGIASIILENPYYGLRKPKEQLRSSLHNVSDLFVMGAALILESLALFHWCESFNYGPLGLTGISMGGHMASISAANWHKPLSLIPCLSWSTASSVFTQGVMSGAIPWKLLEQQYMSDHVYRDEIKQFISTYEESLAFKMGQHFAKNYPESMERLENLREEILSKVNSPSRVEQTASPVMEQSNHDQTTLDKTLSKPMSSSVLRRFKWTNGKRDKKISPTTMNPDALNFMRGMMDECTHVGNYSVPIDTDLIIVVTAENDAYVPRDRVASLEELWPGAEIRNIKLGHISSFLFRQEVFRTAINDSFQRQINKYYPESIEAKEGLVGYSKKQIGKRKSKSASLVEPQRQSAV